MRWAWVDQGAGRPMRRSALRIWRRRAVGARLCLLLMEQETKEDGLIRRAFSSLFDPGCVKTLVLLRFSW